MTGISACLVFPSDIGPKGPDIALSRPQMLCIGRILPTVGSGLRLKSV